MLKNRYRYHRGTAGLEAGGFGFHESAPDSVGEADPNRRFKEDFEKYKYYLPSYSYIGWNLRKPYFSDRRVRQAMTMLMDRETFLTKILFDWARLFRVPFMSTVPNTTRTSNPILTIRLPRQPSSKHPVGRTTMGMVFWIRTECLFLSSF